jgi:hypothetical protein
MDHGQPVAPARTIIPERMNVRGTGPLPLRAPAVPLAGLSSAKLDLLCGFPVRAGLAGRRKVPEQIAASADVGVRELAQTPFRRVSRTG